jgi:ankyrin repeat protein
MKVACNRSLSAGQSLRTAELLLQNKASVNGQNRDANTALICACATGHVELAQLLLAYGKQITHKIVRRLLQQ